MLMEWASLLPDHATYRPHWQQLQDAMDVVVAALPGCRVTAELSSRLKAYESTTWGGMACPQCREPLSEHWGRSQAFRVESEGEVALVVALPCCGVPCSINELYFRLPSGIARCAIRIARERLSDDERAAMDDTLTRIEPEVAAALGCAVRRVIGGY